MRTRLTTLGAAARDNFREWFDFTLYGFFAVAIGQRFFPADDPLLSTMASYAAFAAGFIARPIGAFVFGRMADRTSRKSVLVTTLLLEDKEQFSVFIREWKRNVLSQMACLLCPQDNPGTASES